MTEVERLKTELQWAQERIRAAEAKAERLERRLNAQAARYAGEQGASRGKPEAPWPNE